jgi:multiple sugar transport system ATP-binding protein
MVDRERKEGLVAKATVYVIEPLGSETIIDLAIGDNIIKARTLEVVDLKMGDEVWVGFDMERLHIFDKKTEKAII